MPDFAEWDETHNSPITPEQAHEVAANWRDTTQLSNALDAMAFQFEKADELLRRLSEWDHMQPPTADGPYWLGEIAKVRGLAGGEAADD